MTGRITFSCHIGVVLVCSASLVGIESHAAVSIRKVAMHGDAVPGMPSATFRYVGNPSINRVGQVAFSAGFTGPGIDSSNNHGLCSEVGGTLGLVTRKGDQAPGMAPGVLLGGSSRYVMNGEGHFAFQDAIYRPAPDDRYFETIWSGSPGTLSPIAIEGDIAPGTGGSAVFGITNRQTFISPSLNASGEVAFWGNVTDEGNEVQGIWNEAQGLWAEHDGSLDMIARIGDPAPGVGPKVKFLDFGYDLDISFNDAGQVAFRSIISGTAVNATNDTGIWSGGAGALNVVVREGDTAPGTEPGTVFGDGAPIDTYSDPYYLQWSFSEPSLNAAGDVAFFSKLTGPGVTNRNDQGIWTKSNGTLRRVARTGDQIPGMADGVTFYNNSLGGVSLGVPLINAAGQTAFQGFFSQPFLNSPDSLGVWVDTDGVLELVASTGDPAPGEAEGVLLTGAFSENTPQLMLNDRGQIVFRSALIGPGIDWGTEGLYGTDLNGKVVKIIREGDLIDVNVDPLIEDLREVGGVWINYYSGGDDGKPTNFSDNGDVAMKLKFTDGTEGIFVATIPEPSTLGVLSIGLVLVQRRRSISIGSRYGG